MMECRMSFMTQMEVAEAIGARKAVIIPTGATEAHGPHMPTDTDTHQVEHIAWLLAQHIGALVAPPLAYGISKTFEFFPGTISLSIPTYQLMLFEVGSALVKQGFEHIIILNGNRPNGTANDAVARHLVDELDTGFQFKVSAVSYWEPGAAKIHAMRKSVVGGMGHGCEFETGFQLATRPHLVAGVHQPEPVRDVQGFRPAFGVNSGQQERPRRKIHTFPPFRFSRIRASSFFNWASSSPTISTKAESAGSPIPFKMALNTSSAMPRSNSWRL